MKNTIKTVIYMCLMSMCGPNLALSKNKMRTENPWLAYGDLRANIEPCGCDPKTDLGGIKRLALFLKKERAANSKVVVLNLGNNESSDVAQVAKNLVINKTMDSLKPDVSLLNRIELRKWQSDYESYYKNQNFVLSNALPNFKSRRHFKKLRTPANLLVMGVVSPESKQERKWLQQVDMKLIEKLKKQRKKTPKRYAVLLYSGPVKHLGVLEKAGFDEVILSNRQSFESDFDHSEKEGVISTTFSYGKKEYRSVPLGGLGVLRGGGAQFSKPKALSELLPQKECNNMFNSPSGVTTHCRTPIGGNGLIGENTQLITWLSREYENNDVLTDIFAEYRQGTQRHFQKRAKKRAMDLKESHYVGALACQGCHPSAYETWKKSSHSHAYETLINDKQSENAECVLCHVVGYDKKGGFASIETSPHLSGVQCENCHGARKEHVASGGKKKGHSLTAPKDVCVKCHKGAHSPDFDYAIYWPKIFHGKKPEKTD